MLGRVVAQATEGVFRSFGVSVLPLAPVSAAETPTPCHDLSGTIAYRSSQMRGWLTLALPQAVCELIVERTAQPFPLGDLTRELTNQIMGGIKARLMRYDVVLRFGLPIAGGPGIRQQPKTRGHLVVYPFGTERGELSVILDGTIDETVFAQAETVEATSEGSITLF